MQGAHDCARCDSSLCPFCQILTFGDAPPVEKWRVRLQRTLARWDLLSPLLRRAALEHYIV
jgi:hypothetical protein